MNAGDIQAATQTLKKAIAINPETQTAMKAMYRLGFTQETYLKDYEGAILSYQEFIKQSRDSLSVYEVQKRVAALYFDTAKDPEKAVELYRKLQTSNPTSLEADFFQFRIAEAYFRKNNFEQARIEFESLMEKYPKSQYVARTRYQIGNSYYMEGKYEKAIEVLRHAIRQHAQSEFTVDAQFRLAECLEHMNEYKEAIQIYEAIQDRYPAKEVVSYRITEAKKRVRGN